MYWQSEAASSFKNSTNEYVQMLGRFNEHFTSLSKELNERARIMDETQRNPVVG